MEHKIIQLLPCDIDPESVLLVQDFGKSYEPNYECRVHKPSRLYTALLDNGRVQVVGASEYMDEYIENSYDLLYAVKKDSWQCQFKMSNFICNERIKRHVSSSKKMCKAELVQMVKEIVASYGVDIKIFSRREYEQFYDYYLRERHKWFVERAERRKERQK